MLTYSIRSCSGLKFSTDIEYRNCAFAKDSGLQSLLGKFQVSNDDQHIKDVRARYGVGFMTGKDGYDIKSLKKNCSAHKILLSVKLKSFFFVSVLIYRYNC